MPTDTIVTRRPALTAKIEQRLRALSGFAECEIELMDDGEHKEEIREAINWIDRLCAWYQHSKRVDAALAKLEGKE